MLHRTQTKNKDQIKNNAKQRVGERKKREREKECSMKRNSVQMMQKILKFSFQQNAQNIKKLKDMHIVDVDYTAIC